MRVEAYYNLHKNCISFREIGGRVQHAEAVHLMDVNYAVQPAGRQKVLSENRKNVHAFVRGEPQFIVLLGECDARTAMDSWLATKGGSIWENARRVIYNPYRYETFVYEESGEAVLFANEVIIIGKKIWELA